MRHNENNSRRISALVNVVTQAALFALVPAIAQAHIVSGEASGFASGFKHPLAGPDHFMAMFAVGLWGAQMGGRSVWVLPVIFPLIMVVGGFIGISGTYLPGIETGIALSILVLGLAIAFAWKPAEWVPILLIAVFAICHGYAHGKELPRAADPADYAFGFVIATGLIHLCGIGVGLALHKPFAGKLARAIGALIAIGGVYFLVV
jgi:urease accessory protein